MDIAKKLDFKLSRIFNTNDVAKISKEFRHTSSCKISVSLSVYAKVLPLSFRKMQFCIWNDFQTKFSEKSFKIKIFHLRPHPSNYF